DGDQQKQAEDTGDDRNRTSRRRRLRPQGREFGFRNWLKRWSSGSGVKWRNGCGNERFVFAGRRSRGWRAIAGQGCASHRGYIARNFRRGRDAGSYTQVLLQFSGGNQDFGVTRVLGG